MNLLDLTDEILGQWWARHANCHDMDPEMFFPEVGETCRAAKRICATCRVKTPCLEYALANHERFGVWGGKTERERRLIYRERRTA